MRDYDREIERALRSMNRRTQIEQATRAAAIVHYGGQIPVSPANVSLWRWRAMIQNILKNGEIK